MLGIARGPPNSWGGGPQPQLAYPGTEDALRTEELCTLPWMVTVVAVPPQSPVPSAGVTRPSQGSHVAPFPSAVSSFTRVDLYYWQGWLLRCQKVEATG